MKKSSKVLALIVAFAMIMSIVSALGVTALADGTVSYGGVEYDIVSSDNLISNGGFEDGLTGWTFGAAKTTEANVASSNAYMKLNTANAHSGSNSIASSAVIPQNNLRRFVSVNPSSMYYFSFWTYTTSSSDLTAAFYAAIVNPDTGYEPVSTDSNYASFVASTGSLIGADANSKTTVTGTWTKHEYILKTLANTNKFVFATSTIPNNIYIDDVYLVEIKQSDAYAAFTAACETWESDYHGTFGGTVVSDLDLPISVGEAEVVWTSSNEKVIATDGTFTAPAFDTVVTLTATVKVGTLEKAYTYRYTAASVLNAVYALVTIPEMEDKTTLDVDVTLATAVAGYDDVTVEWYTDKPEVLDAATGAYTEPAESGKINITAAIKMGGDVVLKNFFYDVVADGSEPEMVTVELGSPVITKGLSMDNGGGEVVNPANSLTTMKFSGTLVYEFTWTFTGTGGHQALYFTNSEANASAGNAASAAVFLGAQDTSFVYGGSRDTGNGSRAAKSYAAVVTVDTENKTFTWTMDGETVCENVAFGNTGIDYINMVGMFDAWGRTTSGGNVRHSISDLTVTGPAVEAAPVYIQYIDADGNAIADPAMYYDSYGASYTHEITDEDAVIEYGGKNYIYRSSLSTPSIASLGASNVISLVYTASAFDHFEAYSEKVLPNTAPTLPATVTIVYDDESTDTAEVVWDAYDASLLADYDGGSFTVEGAVAGYTDKAVANIEILAAVASSIETPQTYSTISGKMPNLPQSADVAFKDADGNVESYTLAYDWSEVNSDATRTYEIHFVPEIGYTVSATVNVEAGVAIENALVADTTIQENSDTLLNTVFRTTGAGGAHPALANRYALARFDLTNVAGGDVLYSEMSVYYDTKGNQGNPVFTVYAVANDDDNWEAATATGSSCATMIANATAITTYETDFTDHDADTAYGILTIGERYYFNVTEAVKAAVDAGYDSISLYVASDTCANNFVHSSVNADNAAKLVTTIKPSDQPIVSINAVDDVIVAAGSAPVLPHLVTVVYADDSTLPMAVEWDTTGYEAWAPGTEQIVYGTVEATDIQAKAKVVVYYSTDEAYWSLPEVFNDKYVAVSGNLLEGNLGFADGITGWTAGDGTNDLALSETNWAVVEDANAPDGDGYYLSCLSADGSGGAAAGNIRTYWPVESGKLYALTYYTYSPEAHEAGSFRMQAACLTTTKGSPEDLAPNGGWSSWYNDVNGATPRDPAIGAGWTKVTYILDAREVESDELYVVYRTSWGGAGFGIDAFALYEVDEIDASIPRVKATVKYVGGTKGGTSEDIYLPIGASIDLEKVYDKVGDVAVVEGVVSGADALDTTALDAGTITVTFGEYLVDIAIGASIDPEGNSIYVHALNATDEQREVVYFAAAYDSEGRLIGFFKQESNLPANSFDGVSENISIGDLQDAAKIKVFAWDNTFHLPGMQPLCASTVAK